MSATMLPPYFSTANLRAAPPDLPKAVSTAMLANSLPLLSIRFLTNSIDFMALGVSGVGESAAAVAFAVLDAAERFGEFGGGGDLAF